MVRARFHVSLASVVALGSLSCAHLAPYTPLTRGTRGLEANGVYQATLRVFARNGWPLESSSAERRQVRSQPMAFGRLGLTSGMLVDDYGASVAVKVTEGAIEVSTDCEWTPEAERLNGDAAPCGDGQRPEGLHERELDLVSDILDEAAAPLEGRGAAGCTRDVECKGDRICAAGRCADPAR